MSAAYSSGPNWESGFAVGVNTEVACDWEIDEWTVPVQLQDGQLVVAGRQPLNLQIGGCYYISTSEAMPQWGVRFAVILLFPK